MLTTAGITFSAASTMKFGPRAGVCASSAPPKAETVPRPAASSAYGVQRHAASRAGRGISWKARRRVEPRAAWCAARDARAQRNMIVRWVGGARWLKCGTGHKWGGSKSLPPFLAWVLEAAMLLQALARPRHALGHSLSRGALGAYGPARACSNGGLSFIERAKLFGANALLGAFTHRGGFDSSLDNMKIEEVRGRGPGIGGGIAGWR